MTDNVHSSRDIPLSELYSHLQLEYISYFLRSKIYCRDFAENYRNVCGIKKEKIEKIATKNGLPSIFNDICCKERYLSKFFNQWGIPNFTYRDIEIEGKMGCWDRFYYFQRGCSVKFIVDDRVVLGYVTDNDKNTRIVSVLDDQNLSRDLYYDNVSRLFHADFFNF